MIITLYHQFGGFFVAGGELSAAYQRRFSRNDRLRRSMNEKTFAQVNTEISIHVR